LFLYIFHRFFYVFEILLFCLLFMFFRCFIFIYSCLRQGWGLFKQTCKFSGIQFTKYFIEFVFVETIEMVRSNSNVILTRQTCGHRSSRVAGSKCWALAFCFSIRIWDMYSISICRGNSDLGMCMTSLLSKRMRPHSADFRFKNVFGCRIRRKSALRSRILFASTECTHLDWLSSTFWY